MEESTENVEKREGVLADSGFKSKVRNTGVEVKIAIFSVMVAVLSSFYGLIDPEIGNFIVRVMLPTALVSIIVLLYKVLFGYDPLTIIAIPFTYIGMMGWTFGNSYLVYCALLALFVTFIIKLFVFFFMPEMDYEKNPITYITVGLLLPLALCIAMFVFRDAVSQRYDFLQRNFNKMTVFDAKQKNDVPSVGESVSVPKSVVIEKSAPVVEKVENVTSAEAPKKVQGSSENSGNVYTPNKQKGTYVPPWQKNK